MEQKTVIVNVMKEIIDTLGTSNVGVQCVYVYQRFYKNTKLVKLCTMSTRCEIRRLLKDIAFIYKHA